MDDSDWEDGSISEFDGHRSEEPYKEFTVEFSGTPDSAKRKPVRRATAEEKDIAELVHKVHLLCLLARGRLIDSACSDPLIQASLLSLLPADLLKITEVSKLTANTLGPLVRWFHNNFRVRSVICEEERPPSSALASALETQEGTPEEVAALSVALFRALNLTSRFISVLDVVSLKPDAENSGPLSHAANRTRSGIFQSATVMVETQNQASTSTLNSSSFDDPQENSPSKKTESKSSPIYKQSNDLMPDSSACEGPKRKGDVEFERQLKMALFATSAGFCENNSSHIPSPLRTKRIKSYVCPSSHGISTAVGSRKMGPPLYWAEVYCDGENLTGKWVHVDVVNAIIDGENKVDAAVAACKRSLRYVVAFAGNGAKDVTRRYCMKWYLIASKRVNSIWWDSVLAPLKELESASTITPVKDSATIDSLEDLELEMRALTDPLPSNQQAYKNHQLYAIERWLTKYQIILPKGPILGFCSGHPVYPRTCVQTLHTKERWLREGVKVKDSEQPAKVVQRSQKVSKVQVSETDVYPEGDCEVSQGTVALYGRWQTEPLCLPHAVNGIVPKNERGQVDVWCEKCLPPGTVHLRLQRVVPVAKRLGIDFAPAMVGFEFRNGRSVPVYEGIVVCDEFKGAILEAYAEEEERREVEEKKRNEAQAMSRWYQLLSSIVTRQRLNNSYGGGLSSKASNLQKKDDTVLAHAGDDDRIQQQCKMDERKYAPPVVKGDQHEHVFLVEDQSFDQHSSLCTKRCHCGFSIQVEEL